MAKFDVYRLPDGSGYVLDCQSDLLSGLNTRFVVPLMPVEAAPEPGARLNPIFEIEGEHHAMVTQYAASIPSADLRYPAMSLADQDLTIGRALDFLISGF